MKIFRLRFFSAPDRGVVLIAVLALTALAAAIAMEVAYQARVEADRVTLDHEWYQADLLAHNGVGAAISIIENDDHAVDGVGDPWLQPVMIPQSAGSLEIRISPETARFPLHRLINTEGLLDLDYKRSFSRLIFLLERAEEVTDRFIDYMDADDIPFPQGAESYEYGSRTPPRRPANRRILNLDELGLVQGLEEDAELHARLLEIGTVHGSGRVNINFAQPVVIAALSSGLSLMQAERVAAEADRVPFQAISEVSRIVEVSAEVIAELERKGSVGTDVFRVETKGVVGAVEVRLTSIVEKNAEGNYVVVHMEPDWRDERVKESP